MAITVGASTITMNSGSVLQDPPGTAPSFLCRAFVNFNGTGTVAIRASGNVSSITDNNTGNYTVNLTTAMVDANYSAVAFAEVVSSTCIVSGFSGSRTSSAIGLNIYNLAGTNIDPPIANVAIFR